MIEKQDFINNIIGSETLDLSVEVKDTDDVNITVVFKALTFEKNSEVSIIVDIITTNKTVNVFKQGALQPMAPVITKEVLVADERTQIPVLKPNGDPLTDTLYNPITIPENLYWKYIAWENPIGIPFKTLLQSIIEVKFDMIQPNVALQLTEDQMISLNLNNE